MVLLWTCDVCADVARVTGEGLRSGGIIYKRIMIVVFVVILRDIVWKDYVFVCDSEGFCLFVVVIYYELSSI